MLFRFSKALLLLCATFRTTMATTKTTDVQVDDGIHLHVTLIEDQPTDGTKPLLIALHGAPGLFTSAEPEAAFGYLSPHFRVLVFDGRGSGQSDIKGPYTHERWMKDIDFVRSVFFQVQLSNPEADEETGSGQAPRNSCSQVTHMAVSWHSTTP
jgi:predicted alpha/beta-fold hydrolase